MKIARALIGIPILLAAIILVVLAIIAIVLLMMALCVLGMFFFCFAICILVPSFLFLFIVSLFELIPATIRKKPIWGCQYGKALFEKIADFLKDIGDFLENQVLEIIDDFMIEGPNFIGTWNDWFGTTELLEAMIDKMNEICRGEYKNKAIP